MFNTDDQTIADLELFSKGAHNSVMKLYSQTRTRGGAQLLEEMFRNPLSNPQSINNRSATIQYFAERQLAFRFEPELFDSAEQYLSERDERTKLTGIQQSLGQKISSLVAVDAMTKNILKGIAAVVALLQGLHIFLNNNDVVQCGSFATERQSILTQLANPAFAGILGQLPNNKLRQDQLSAYDKIFRFSHYGEVAKLMRQIYSLDVYMAVGKVATEKGFAYPMAVETSSCNIVMTGFYHPLLNNAISNDIVVTPNNNVIFLTGANMAGKSTLMKSFGINLYLAHMGFPLAAKEVSFSVMDGIYTTINLPDNLGMGISHFYAEVLRLKKIATELSRSKKLLVIFDELFRGTNVKDAYEGTIAVASAFARNHSSVFVISTHITEAGEVLQKDCKNISFRYMPTRMSETKPIYTYLLETGISDDRHGMIIINNEKIVELLQKGKAKSV